MRWRDPDPGLWQATVAVIVVALAVVVLAGLLARWIPWTDSSAQIAMTLLTAIFVGVTWWNVEFVRRTLWHIREQREGEFRPYVIPRWLPERGDGPATLRVEASGRGVARDLKVSVVPESLKTPDGTPLARLPLLAEGLDVFAPGLRLDIPVDPASLPGGEPVYVRLRYGDFYVPPRDFAETFVLRPQALVGVRVTEDAPDSREA